MGIKGNKDKIVDKFCVSLNKSPDFESWMPYSVTIHEGGSEGGSFYRALFTFGTEDEAYNLSYNMSIGSESFNYTYNVAPMWYACYEEGIRKHYGMTGAESLPVLRKLRDFMEDNYDTLILMNPENEWGSYAGALTFVNELIEVALRNPYEIWEGD